MIDAHLIKKKKNKKEEEGELALFLNRTKRKMVM